MRWTIRPGTPDDVDAIQHIEVAAGQLFAAIGMDTIADDDPPGHDVLLAHVTAGTVWMAVDSDGAGGDGEAVGYVLASVVDGEAHVDQVSVAPAAAGHGIGAALIDRVCAWAADGGHDTITLTTFRDVPWNGPYYRRLGFDDVAASAMGPELAAIRRSEAEAGIDVAPRVAMRRTL